MIWCASTSSSVLTNEPLRSRMLILGEAMYVSEHMGTAPFLSIFAIYLKHFILNFLFKKSNSWDTTVEDCCRSGLIWAWELWFLLNALKDLRITASGDDKHVCAHRYLSTEIHNYPGHLRVFSFPPGPRTLLKANLPPSHWMFCSVYHCVYRVY